MTRGLQKDFMFVGSLFNGWFVGQLVMNALFVHVPFLIALVAGDVFAGEATGGTFRMLLTRPPSRTRIFGVKTASTVIYVVSLVVFLGAFTLGLGMIWFGTGSMISFGEEGITIFASGDVWWRFLGAYMLGAWGMCVVAALALLLSTLVENAIGPIIGTVAITILFLILGNLPFDFFEKLRPYFYTTYFNVWMQMFTDPVDWARVARESAYLAGYFALFTGSAWLVFLRKDVLS
jgi:ABC-2 type transport system permease protein